MLLMEKVIKLSNYNEFPTTRPASTHRRSHIQRARQRESRFWRKSRPELKTSKKWVSLNQFINYSLLISVLPHFPDILHFLHGIQLVSPLHLHSPFSSSLPLAPLQVTDETEQYLQQLLMRAVAVLPQWRVQVQKCKAIHMVLNLCSPSVTEKCLIAEAWCPVRQLPALQSALREGGVRIQHSCNCFSLIKEHLSLKCSHD